MSAAGSFGHSRTGEGRRQHPETRVDMQGWEPRLLGMHGRERRNEESCRRLTFSSPAAPGVLFKHNYNL